MQVASWYYHIHRIRCFSFASLNLSFLFLLFIFYFLAIPSKVVSGDESWVLRLAMASCGSDSGVSTSRIDNHAIFEQQIKQY